MSAMSAHRRIRWKKSRAAREKRNSSPWRLICYHALRAAFAHLSAVWLSTHRGPSQIFHPKRRSTTRTSFNRHWEVSNIDQRVIMPSRYGAVITAPCRHSSVTHSSVALPPDLTGSIYAGSPRCRLAWRRGLVVANASRAWRYSASQSRSARSLPRRKNNGRDVRSTETVRCRINCRG